MAQSDLSPVDIYLEKTNSGAHDSFMQLVDQRAM